MRGNCWTLAPDGRQLYFRYYDPRVLRGALSAMSPEALDAFFGPLTGLLLEAATPDLMDSWTRAGAGIHHRRAAVAIPDRPSAPAAFGA